jgi:hypothetical protein
MARSSRSMRKAGLPFSRFKITKAPSNACRLFITSSIFFFWMVKIFARSRSRPGGSWLLKFSKRRLKPKILRVLVGRLQCSEWAHVRRQSRNRIFRETPGEHQCTIAKAQASHLPVINLPEKSKAKQADERVDIRQRCRFRPHSIDRYGRLVAIV